MRWKRPMVRGRRVYGLDRRRARAAAAVNIPSVTPPDTTEPDRDPRVVLVTAPDEVTGRRLARGLVEQSLAACVNVLAGVTSVYRWEGAVTEDAECLLVIKTVRGRLREVEAWIAREHPYDVPEFIALAPAQVAGDYLAWWLRAVGAPPTGSEASRA